MVLRIRGQNLRDTVNVAMGIARKLERQERSRVFSVKSARFCVAERLKIGVGTFENIVRGRVKSVDSALRDRMQTLLVREFEHEIARLTNELEIARQAGARLGSDQICEIEALLEKATSLLNGAVQ